MPADLHLLASVHELTSDCICLHSKLADALQLVQNIICHAFMLAALAHAHFALKSSTADLHSLA
jgi:hypothetical protein